MSADVRDPFPEDLKSRLSSRYRKLNVAATHLWLEAELFGEDNEQRLSLDELEELVESESPPLTEEGKAEYERWKEWVFSCMEDFTLWREEMARLEENIPSLSADIHERKARLRQRLRSFGDEVTLLQLLAHGWRTTTEIIHFLEAHGTGDRRTRSLLKRLVVRGDIERRQCVDGRRGRTEYRLRRSGDGGSSDQRGSES